MQKRNWIDEFIKNFSVLVRERDDGVVWSDFMELTTISLSNIFPSKERECREKSYQNIIGKYSKNEQFMFPRLVGIIVMALEENSEQDFLGEIYYKLRLAKKSKAQIFTPYSVCRIMSKITGIEMHQKDIERNGFTTIHDPVCGAGATLIASANELRQAGINFQNQVLFVGQDIDPTAAMMCYIQLSFLGCSAYIIIGDTIAKPGRQPDNRVLYTPFYYLNEWRFRNWNQVLLKTTESSVQETKEKKKGQDQTNFDLDKVS